METHPIDSIIKKAVIESEDFYNLDADKAKERIWNQVKTQKQGKPLLVRLLVAACILLLLGTSSLIISYLITKNKMKSLTELNASLSKQIQLNAEKDLNIQSAPMARKITVVDTVYIEKKSVIEKPVFTVKHIRDTFFIEKIVFTEKELDTKLLANIASSKPADLIDQKSSNDFETEILISNIEPVKRTKRNKIKFRFGGNESKTTNGTLALTSEL